MDKFFSCFGQINIDPDSHLFVLYMKKNFSFFLKLFRNVSFVRASCEEQSKSIENHCNLQIVHSQILNEQRKTKESAQF